MISKSKAHGRSHLVIANRGAIKIEGQAQGRTAQTTAARVSTPYMRREPGCCICISEPNSGPARLGSTHCTDYTRSLFDSALTPRTMPAKIVVVEG